MKFLSDAWAIFKTELTLFQRFPKLRLSAIGVIVIPAVYALTYLSSVITAHHRGYGVLHC
jgi:hypothetical protein